MFQTAKCPVMQRTLQRIDAMNPAGHSPASFTSEACANCAGSSGCADCFEELVRRFQTPLLHFLRRRGNSRHNAEDLVQETFLLAYRNIKTYKSRWRFSTWIFTIANRQSASQNRKRPRPVNSAMPIEAPSRHVDPLTGLEETEFRGKLWDTAGQILEADAFTSIWLSYVESMSAEEIGEVIGRNANAVRILMHRARTRLAERLGSDFQIPGAAT